MERGEGKKGKGKFILIGLAVVTAGVGSYFAYQHFKKTKQKNNNSVFLENDTPITASNNDISIQTSSTSTGSSSKPNTGFPLKKRSKGVLVRKLQEALVKHFGLNIAIDGDFGSQTQNALITAGFPTSVTSSVFDKIITGKKTSTGSQSKPNGSKKDPSKLIAKGLKIALYKNDLNKTIKFLSYLKNTSAYTKASNEFKKSPPLGHFTRKTIVTALLGQFNDAGDKRQLEKAFLRIGLKKSDSKWSLSGLSGGELITISSATVWDNSGKTIEVPIDTILGTYIEGYNGITEFETIDGNRLFTATNAIQYK